MQKKEQRKTVDYIYTRLFDSFGNINIRPFNLNTDATPLHNWVTKKCAVFWGMQNYSSDGVKKEYKHLTHPNTYDVFDGVFRFMPAILVEHSNFKKTDFWKLVAKNIYKYQDRYLENKTKFMKYDLFASDSLPSCLNRIQLNNNKQIIDLDDPAALLQFVGIINNPIAEYRKKTFNFLTI